MEDHLRIGFDGRLAGPLHAGIGRYSEELLKRVLFSKFPGHSVQWVVWVRPDHGMTWLEQRAAAENIQLRTTTISHYGLMEQTLWLRELYSTQLDLLHVPHFNVPLGYARPFVVTIHDLLWHSQRDSRATTLSPWMHMLKYAAYRVVSESAIQRARAILVPSQQVQKEIAQYTGRRNKVFVTYEGIPEVYRLAGLAKAKKEPFIVYTGSLYPHKNIEVVLRALQGMKDTRLKLVSTRSVFTEKTRERARALGVEDQLEFLGFVPDEELIRLYGRARALVQPSKSEGFGLTGLEAMAVGCPVIASSLPIFKEIYGEHAQYFDPDSPNELALALGREVSAQALKEARSHALGYSWDKLAEETIQVYEMLLAHSGS